MGTLVARWGRAGPLWAAGAPAPPPPRAPGGWRCPACPALTSRGSALRPAVLFHRAPRAASQCPWPNGPPRAPCQGPGQSTLRATPRTPAQTPPGDSLPPPLGLPAVPPSVSCHRPACHTAQGVGPPEAECQTSRHARLVPGPGGRSSAQLLGARVALVTGQESQCRGPMWGGSLPGQSTDLGYRLRPKAETVLGVSHMKSASPGHQGPCPVGNELGPYRAPLGTPV